MTSHEGRVWSTATLQRRAAERAVWRRTAVELGRALRHERRMAGLAQHELAAALGITQGVVSELERGTLAQGATLRWCARADAALQPMIASQPGWSPASSTAPSVDSLTAGD
jgi:predicted XRE-type DNA-binding protein